MKNYIALLILIIFGSLHTNDQAVLQQAHNCCLALQWQQALDLYKTVGNKNSDILQNIGICYFNQKNYINALLYWKRAYTDAQGSKITRLLDLQDKAYKALHKDVCSNVYYFITTVFYFPLWVFQLIIVLCLLFFIYIMFQYILMYDAWISPLMRCLIFFVTIIFSICCGIWYARCMILAKNKALVVKSNVCVYAGPEKTFHVIGIVQPATMVSVINDKYQDMYHIQTKTITGWTPAQNLEFVYKYE
jgi:hypothetical protein